MEDYLHYPKGFCSRGHLTRCYSLNKSFRESPLGNPLAWEAFAARRPRGANPWLTTGARNESSAGSGLESHPLAESVLGKEERATLDPVLAGVPTSCIHFFPIPLTSTTFWKYGNKIQMNLGNWSWLVGSFASSFGSLFLGIFQKLLFIYQTDSGQLAKILYPWFFINLADYEDQPWFVRASHILSSSTWIGYGSLHKLLDMCHAVSL